MYDKTMKTFISVAIAVFIGAFIIAMMLLVRHSQQSETESSSVYESSSFSMALEIGDSLYEMDAVTSTTTSAPDETVTQEPQKAYVEYSFRSKKQFDSHYKKHGKEFGKITQEEYLRKANNLINDTSDTILHKTEAEDGDYIYYDSVNNEILFLSKDGYIRTYFKPSRGIDYYNDQ